jgi:hypothetical protein
MAWSSGDGRPDHLTSVLAADFVGKPNPGLRLGFQTGPDRLGDSRGGETSKPKALPWAGRVSLTGSGGR